MSYILTILRRAQSLHTYSGMLYLLGLMFEAAMVELCWAGEDLDTFIRALNFLEFVSFNMYAMTNLIISTDLTLIIMVSVRLLCSTRHIEK